MTDGPFHSMQRFAELVGQAKIAEVPASLRFLDSWIAQGHERVCCAGRWGGI